MARHLNQLTRNSGCRKGGDGVGNLQQEYEFLLLAHVPPWQPFS